MIKNKFKPGKNMVGVLAIFGLYTFVEKILRASKIMNKNLEGQNPITFETFLDEYFVAKSKCILKLTIFRSIDGDYCCNL